ncbi:sulfotransferase family protein [Erythrobacter sp. EC-HK427]|uniref:sulfotransferase family protein n=1 Tax=Erythrobacter sp. EC-HK427 TaxID=2038396 RepID=UPI00125A8261|nr:sulfotransferase [Erythrobacter sp. EC-HK427]VVT14418.1 Sulfotransferase family protein [Erythrobacter sp. EC-HK427]
MPDARQLPTFLIIGAGKSGTTSLWNYLDQHPQAGMSRIKEPSYFSMDDVHARGLDWYATLYAGKENALVRGEASNSYSALETFPHTLDRIAEVMEAPKFLYIVRHPRARSESDWMQRSKISDVSFTDFLHNDPVYADKNRYLRTLEAYEARFGAGCVKVLFYDDLRSDAAGLLRGICEFLGIDPDFAFDFETRHGQSKEARKFVGGLGKLRNTKLYADLSMALPSGVKEKLRGALSTTHAIERPEWSAADIAWFREQFEAPSRAFLERVGRGADYWDWDEGWSR